MAEGAESAPFFLRDEPAVPLGIRKSLGYHERRWCALMAKRISLLFPILLVALCMASGQATAPDTSSQADRQSNVPDYSEARRLMQQGKFDEAIADLQQIQTANPSAEELDQELGLAYYKKGDYLKAVDSLKKAKSADPEDKEAVQLLGLSYYLSGQPAQAIPLLEKVQGWYPRANIDASYILGIAYIQTKDYPHARQAFAKMFDVDAQSAASYLFTARMLFRQEYDPIAEEYAQKAVSLDSKLPLAHFLLGEIYIYKSRVPEAITEFQRELAINPGHAATYYKLADAYSRVQKFDDAERLLQRSIWLDSTSTGPYILMGKVLEKKGESELAVRALQHAASMDPNNSVTHHLLGQAYRDLGKNDDASRELKLAEQLQQAQNAKP